MASMHDHVAYGPAFQSAVRSRSWFRRRCLVGPSPEISFSGSAPCRRIPEVMAAVIVKNPDTLEDDVDIPARHRCSERRCLRDANPLEQPVGQ